MTIAKLGIVEKTPECDYLSQELEHRVDAPRRRGSLGDEPQSRRIE
jgi:hypothetical protein